MSEILYERLQRLKRQRRESRPTDPPRSDHHDNVHEALEREPPEDEGTAVARQSLERLGFFEQSDGVFARTVEREVGSAAHRIAGKCSSGGVILPAEAGQPAFFDVESTGLGAGAGNVAFLVGVTTLIDEKRVRVEQLLLRDFPDEPQFLDATSRLLSDDRLLISYNGKGFDTNLLRSRFLMNGIRWREPQQLDLLYPARRLWANIFPDCRLSTVERQLLSVERGRDVSGAEVPERYFAFLETGAAEVLRDVVAHHEQDMVSLVLLLDVLEETLSRAKGVVSGRFGESPDADPVGVARALLAASDTEAAIGWLYRTISGHSPSGQARKAMVLLAGLLKQRARYQDAARLWSRLFHEGHSVLAGIELAKYLEHRAKNISAALAICEKLLDHSGSAREDIVHRYERLTRKMSR